MLWLNTCNISTQRHANHWRVIVTVMVVINQ